MQIELWNADLNIPENVTIADLHHILDPGISFYEPGVPPLKPPPFSPNPPQLSTSQASQPRARAPGPNASSLDKIKIYLAALPLARLRQCLSVPLTELFRGACRARPARPVAGAVV